MWRNYPGVQAWQFDKPDTNAAKERCRALEDRLTAVHRSTSWRAISSTATKRRVSEALPYTLSSPGEAFLVCTGIVAHPAAPSGCRPAQDASQDATFPGFPPWRSGVRRAAPRAEQLPVTRNDARRRRVHPGRRSLLCGQDTGCRPHSTAQRRQYSYRVSVRPATCSEGQPWPRYWPPGELPSGAPEGDRCGGRGDRCAG